MSNQIRHQTLHTLNGNTPVFAEPMSTQQANRQVAFSGIPYLITDLCQWIDCCWAVAISTSDHSVTPIQYCGAEPDLGACMDLTKSLLARGETLIESDVTSVLGTAHDQSPQIIAPIRIRGRIAGALAFGPKRGAGTYSRMDRNLITEAAAHISGLLDDENLVSRLVANLTDLDTARDVKSRLLPQSLPPMQWLDYYGESRPAGDVGGDFFDFIPLEGSALAMSLGDVSGKGVAAAITMARMQVSLRGFTAASSGSLATVVQDLNRQVCQISPENMYATLFYASIDPRSRRLQYVNAGHEPALLVRQRGELIQSLESTGTVLGLSGRSRYRQRTLSLEPNDVLVAFSDGITEASDDAGHEMREAGVVEAVRSHHDARSNDLACYIMEAVDRLTGYAAPADDRTVIVVRVTGAASRGLHVGHEAELAFAAA